MTDNELVQALQYCAKEDGCCERCAMQDWCDGMEEVLLQAANRLEALLHKNNGTQWLSVGERLPEDNGDLVLVIVNGEYENIRFEDAITIAEFAPEGWVLESHPECENPSVAYWMPLPEQP